MGLVLRSIGTLLLGLALILVVIDGTRMLAANALVLTPLQDIWEQFVPHSLEAFKSLVLSHLHPALWDPAITTILAAPGWVVLGGLGIVLALLGRRRHRSRLVSADMH